VGANSYTRNFAQLTWRQELIAGFSLQAHAGYALEDYESSSGFPDRDDDIYLFGSRLSYDLTDWLQTSLGYEFEELTSSDELYEAEEYRINRIIWMIETSL
jgi:hypothetical protein